MQASMRTREYDYLVYRFTKPLLVTPLLRALSRKTARWARRWLKFFQLGERMRVAIGLYCYSVSWSRAVLRDDKFMEVALSETIESGVFGFGERLSK